MNSQSWYVDIRDPIDAACVRAETYLVDTIHAGSTRSPGNGLECSMHIHITHDIQHLVYTFGIYVL